MSFGLMNTKTKKLVLIARALIGEAKGRQLHRAILRALAKVSRAERAVSASAKRPVAADGSGAALLAAMIEVRRRFAAFADALDAFSRMPEGEAMGEAARSTLPRVLPDGTTFLAGSVETMVFDGEQVIARARDKEIAKALAALHCDRLVTLAAESLRALAEVHESALRAEAGSTPPGFTAGQELLTAIREYASVVQAAGLVDEATPVEDLLAPIRNASAKAKRQQAPQANAAPVAPVAPADDEASEKDEAPPSVAA